MTDGFAYLADNGWPLERLQWYMRNGMSMDDLADSVQSMIESGRYTMEDLILADSNGDDESKPPPPQRLSIISAPDLQRANLPRSSLL